uniref:Uncharacterized protein n=1 Tax=Stegastes partitus TaxID=144197 RepID=A0A3B5ATK2_9TELE
ILGNFTWPELCDVINEQVDQLTSDLQKANDKIAHLQSVCHKKSVCVRELQRSQECVLSQLKESVKRREEAWNSQHTNTVEELQVTPASLSVAFILCHCVSLCFHCVSLSCRCVPGANRTLVVFYFRPVVGSDVGGAAAVRRLLRSDRLPSILLSSMSDLQEAVSIRPSAGSAPPHLMSAARSGLSRLLDQLLDQSGDSVEADTLRLTPRPDVKVSEHLRALHRCASPPPADHLSSRQALVSNLQQHFLLFSQRLHSAEVERRSLRVELANQRRGQRREREDKQQAQTLIQEQSERLHALQLQVDTHDAQQTDTQSSLSRTTQVHTGSESSSNAAALCCV